MTRQGSLWIVVAASALAGCVQPNFSQAGPACTTAQACSAGLVCFEERCVVAAPGFDSGVVAPLPDAGVPPSDTGSSDAGASDAGPSDSGVSDTGATIDVGPIARCADGEPEGGEAIFGRRDMVFCGATNRENSSLPESKGEAAVNCGAGSHLCSALEYRARNDACSLEVRNMAGWLADGDDCVVRIRPREFSNCQADGTRPPEFGTPSSGSCPQSYSGGDWGLESVGAEDLLDASCTLNSLGCGAFCCIDAPAPGAATSPETAALSCYDLFDRVPNTPSGAYWIDPDGVGGVEPARVHCQVSQKAWMTVATIRDTANDDVPNTATQMYLGWYRDEHGLWNGPGASLVGQTNTETAVVGFDFIVAAQSHGYTELKMTFFRDDEDGAGEQMAFRSTLGGTETSLTLVAADTETVGSYLVNFGANALVYTFGRLIGIPGSPLLTSVIEEGFCIPRANGASYFGGTGPGMCEYPDARGTLTSPWHGWGNGCVYSVRGSAQDELSSCDADQFILELGRP
jgi:hypothetical protein